MCDHVGPARNRRKRRNDSRRCRWRRKNNAWNCKRRSVTDGAWVVVVPLEQTLVIDVEKNIACQGQVFIRSAIAKHSYQYQKVLSLSLWSWLLLQFAIMYIYMYRCPVISIAHVTQYTYDRIGKRVFFLAHMTCSGLLYRCVSNCTMYDIRSVIYLNFSPVLTKKSNSCLAIS